MGEDIPAIGCEGSKKKIMSKIGNGEVIIKMPNGKTT